MDADTITTANIGDTQAVLIRVLANSSSSTDKNNKSGNTLNKLFASFGGRNSSSEASSDTKGAPTQSTGRDNDKIMSILPVSVAASAASAAATDDNTAPCLKDAHKDAHTEHTEAGEDDTASLGSGLAVQAENLAELESCVDMAEDGLWSISNLSVVHDLKANHAERVRLLTEHPGTHTCPYLSEHTFMLRDEKITAYRRVSVDPCKCACAQALCSSRV